MLTAVKNAWLMPGRLWRVTCLCVVLLLAQTLGPLHGLTHGSGRSSHPVSQVFPELNGAFQKHPLETHDHGTHQSLFDGLFAGHNDESAACLTFDQLGHFDTLAILPLVLPMVLTTFQLTASAGLALARWHAQFQARGPPLTH